MKWTYARALALAVPVQAGLRFQCSTLTVQRLDPVVQPGSNPSAHVHHIVGGNAFNATMTGDYFKHPQNGSYHRVPVIPVNPGNLDGYTGTSGGITVYYTQHDLSRDMIAQNPVKTFPPGFRMTVGSPNRNRPSSRRVTLSMPVCRWRQRPRDAGFPYLAMCGRQCWDGKNLDSPDHQSHMYNTITMDGFMNAPACPASHPVRMPQVTYETVWDTSKFNSMWPSGTPNPFVWSFEGVNGRGNHADYMFGWKGDALQRAMNKSECFYDGCGSLQKQAMATANKCTVKDMVGEQTEGWLSKLPGA
ncbi:hypothetical protein NUW58_g1689 [Xylaria curta]|uniref:Uncharacterized protein n=1 Tax=Xylaria curta TaxID=42375 RepID=A0ACC1PKF2_9PEZI|nr:hypothetical protein NUW58_g1689 [Xylaria curta]